MIRKMIISGLIAAAMTTTAYARDNVRVAGSSTVLPYAIIVAELFGENFIFPTPVVESGGSSAGLKEFCRGVGPNTIDIANSSRQIKESEVKACSENGVTDIIEVRFGYDGIVFASRVEGPEFALTPTEIFFALTPYGAKPFPTNWKQINPDFPDQKIIVFIPGEKHGTREVFEEKIMLQGCKDSGTLERLMFLQSITEKQAAKECVQVRKDGIAVDIDGDYTETLARLESNPDAMGVFGLSFYENNTDKLKVATVNGVLPSVDTISTGEYPVSRPLFFYVKKAHIGVIPGLAEYVEFFASERMIGPDGPLAEYGLVPAPDEEREQLQTQLNSLQ